MKNILYKTVLAVSLFTSVVLVLSLFKAPQIVEIKVKTWNGEYMQVLVEPFNQSEALLGYNEYVGEEGVFGGMRPSNFKTTLARSLTATASTSEEIFVSSLTTKDSHTLDSSDIGDNVCMHINPGASNDEIICCTGINTTNKSFTGCTRGYLFYSTSTTSGNAKAHSPGETVVISNDDHYLSVQYPQLDSTATITGLWTWGSTDSIASIQFGPGNSTYDKRIYIYNGDANKPYIGYDESEDKWVVANNGVDTVSLASGSSDFTAGDGLTLTADDFDVAITSASGLYFISDEYLGIYASTSNPIYIDDDGMVSGIEASSSYTMGTLTLGTYGGTGILTFPHASVSDDLTLGTPLDEDMGGLGTVSWDTNDLIYFSADNVAANIASGSDGAALVMSQGSPGWGSYFGTDNYWGTLSSSATGGAEGSWEVDANCNMVIAYVRLQDADAQNDHNTTTDIIVMRYGKTAGKQFYNQSADYSIGVTFDANNNEIDITPDGTGKDWDFDLYCFK